MRLRPLRCSYLATILVAALAGAAVAQTPQIPMGQQADALNRHFFQPRLVLANAARIGLTQQQRERIESVVHQSQDVYRRQRFELSNAMTVIAGMAVSSPVDEDAILGQLDRILDIERQIKRSQLMMLVRVKNTLTPEQHLQLDEIRRRMWQERRSRQQDRDQQ